MTSVNPNLITCIVQRGEADKVVKAAQEAGAEGATIYYGRGTGIREALGFRGRFIKPEKEIILIVVKGEQTDQVFEAVVKAARLEKKGKGFAFLHSIDRAVGFLEPENL
ncbi:MAG: P-II family nitrogen regulator [Proteobacteria bacterium]|nr:P-II family nitrogen regulator [Pseudomonadota bacterium]MBU1709255.1 P-II family nitrogen regulator [Pseudomonadota bacterium]